MAGYEMMCCIVNNGHGSKALRVAKHHGVRGGTICMGKGTIKSRLLEFLDITDVRKEIVFLGTDSDQAVEQMHAVAKDLALHKPHHGIIFSFTADNFMGTRQHSDYMEPEGDTMAQDTKYNAIYTIVDKGKAEDVVDAANRAGAQGGTIINARGSGIHETGVLFAMPIEPERELVLILAENSITKAVAEGIRVALRLDEPGNGVLFVLGVREAIGLY